MEPALSLCGITWQHLRPSRAAMECPEACGGHHAWAVATLPTQRVADGRTAPRYRYLRCTREAAAKRRAPRLSGGQESEEEQGAKHKRSCPPHASDVGGVRLGTYVKLACYM